MSADDAFVREHEGFVRSIALRVKAEFDLNCDLEDLLAFGFAGLVEARTRFDPARGVQFSTFAYYRVRGACVDGVRKMAYLPRRAYQMRKFAEAADAMLELEGETRASTASGKAGVEEAVHAIDDILGRLTASFVISCVGQDEDEKAPERPDDQLVAASQAERVRHALEALPERERKVVTEMYFDNRPLDDIAKDLGVSKSWASRLHTKGLAMLRDALGDEA